MNTESITRKRLGTTYTSAEFVCVMGNVVALECKEDGKEVRITLPLDQLDLALAEAKVKASEGMSDEEKRATLERENEEAEEYRRSLIRNENDFDPQDSQ